VTFILFEQDHEHEHEFSFCDADVFCFGEGTRTPKNALQNAVGQKLK